MPQIEASTDLIVLSEVYKSLYSSVAFFYYFGFRVADEGNDLDAQIFFEGTTVRVDVELFTSIQ